MTRILLIRHGTTDAMRAFLCGRTPGIHLNDIGTTQARELRRSLARISDLEAVYASPLERAIETATEIATPHRLPVEVDEAWNEIDFGAWQGCAFSELDRLLEWRNFNLCRSTSHAPGGESMPAVQARAALGLTSIQRSHPNSAVAVVSHCDVIRAIVLLLLGMPLDHIFRLEIAPASVTSFSIGEGLTPVLHYLNRIPDQENRL